MTYLKKRNNIKKSQQEFEHDIETYSVHHTVTFCFINKIYDFAKENADYQEILLP